MAFLEEVAERLGGGGMVGAGVAAILLAPALRKPAGEGLRTVVKAGLVGYLVAGQRIREARTDLARRWTSLVTEVHEEVGGNGPPRGEAEESTEAAATA